MALAKTEVELYSNGFHSKVDRVNQHCVQAAVNKKCDKYQFISDLVNLRSKVRAKNKNKMVFVPAVVTHNGQLNFELFEFIEKVTMRYKRLQANSFDINGKSVQERVSEFRIAFKNSLVFALVSKWACQLRYGVVGVNEGSASHSSF